jgi:hypothetical protein
MTSQPLINHQPVHVKQEIVKNNMPKYIPLSSQYGPNKDKNTK